MKRDEFLEVFREALEGKLSEREINDNVEYYRLYINSEVGKGQSEEEVIEKIGNPRLLAKTLEESAKFARGGGAGAYSDYDSGYKEYGEYGDSGIHGKRVQIPIWLLAILCAIVVIFVVAVVLEVTFFLLPYIIAFLIVVFVLRNIAKWINR
jgi:Flp pilus assembly protein TadB